MFKFLKKMRFYYLYRVTLQDYVVDCPNCQAILVFKCKPEQPNKKIIICDRHFYLPKILNSLAKKKIDDFRFCEFCLSGQTHFYRKSNYLWEWIFLGDGPSRFFPIKNYWPD